MYLLDGYAVRPGGVHERHAPPRAVGRPLRHAHGPDPRWRRFRAGDAPLPRGNPVAERVYANFLQRAKGDGAHFGRLRSGEWGGVFFQYARYPRAWSTVSRMTFTRARLGNGVAGCGGVDSTRRWR